MHHVMPVSVFWGHEEWWALPQEDIQRGHFHCGGSTAWGAPQRRWDMPPLAGVLWVGCGRLSPQSQGSPPGGPGPGASVNGARLRRPRGWASGKKAPWRGQSRGGPAPPRLPPACAGLRGGGFLSQPPCWGGRGLGGSAWSPTVALARADRGPRMRTPLVPGPEPSGARSRAVTLGRGSVGPKLHSPFCPTLNVGQGDAVPRGPLQVHRLPVSSATPCTARAPQPGSGGRAPADHLASDWAASLTPNTPALGAICSF